jgi:hypothetical protein
MARGRSHAIPRSDRPSQYLDSAERFNFRFILPGNKPIGNDAFRPDCALPGFLRRQPFSLLPREREATSTIPNIIAKSQSVNLRRIGLFTLCVLLEGQNDRGQGMRKAFCAIAMIAMTATLGIAALGSANPGPAPVPRAARDAAPPAYAGEEPARKLDLYMEAYVTGYNTVRRQTDDTPCIAASGANICGRRNTVACPRMFDLGTVVEINGRKYVCEDRMAPRFRGNFDINCDKDRSCPYKVAGWKTIRIYLE